MPLFFIRRDDGFLPLEIGAGGTIIPENLDGEIFKPTPDQLDTLSGEQIKSFMKAMGYKLKMRNNGKANLVQFVLSDWDDTLAHGLSTHINYEALAVGRKVLVFFKRDNATPLIPFMVSGGQIVRYDFFATFTGIALTKSVWNTLTKEELQTTIDANDGIWWKEDKKPELVERAFHLFNVTTQDLMAANATTPVVIANNESEDDVATTPVVIANNESEDDVATSEDDVATSDEDLPQPSVPMPATTIPSVAEWTQDDQERLDLLEALQNNAFGARVDYDRLLALREKKEKAMTQSTFDEEFLRMKAVLVAENLWEATLVIHIPTMVDGVSKTKHIPVQWGQSTTIQDIKDEIVKQSEIDIRDMRLYHQQKEMKEEYRRIAEYPVKEDNNIHLFLRIRGGTKGIKKTITKKKETETLRASANELAQSIRMIVGQQDMHIFGEKLVAFSKEIENDPANAIRKLLDDMDIQTLYLLKDNLSTSKANSFALKLRQSASLFFGDEGKKIEEIATETTKMMDTSTSFLVYAHSKAGWTYGNLKASMEMALSKKQGMEDRGIKKLQSVVFLKLNL